MAKTKIQWTGRTWNPIVSGCSIISKGCTNCYAMKMAFRLEHMGQEKYKGLTKKTASGNIVWNGKINIDMDDKALLEPLQRKAPTTYFVNSMTDIFHENVPFEALDKIYAVMALCPQHTFQVLTKRPERMVEYLKTYMKRNGFSEFVSHLLLLKNICSVDIINNTLMVCDFLDKNPLPNLWLGVSVENQEQADIRIPLLLQVPLKVRFLSCEPLLECLRIAHLNIKKDFTHTEFFPLQGKSFFHTIDKKMIDHEIGKIDWVIVGGESGAKARPMHPDWVRSIRNQCQAADVPFFFKQWGAYNENGIKGSAKQNGNILDGHIYENFPKTF